MKKNVLQKAAALLAVTTLLAALNGCGKKQEVAAEAPVQRPTAETHAAEATPEPLPTEEPVVIPVDFEEWQGINPDVYAWINVPNTNIDYPVLQSGEDKDSDYYLEYCIDNTYGRPGCIYSEKDYNTKTFQDYVTILYGHDMWTNDTYFHQLHKLEDPEFFKDNRQILIYTPEEILNYTIFAAVTYDDRHLMMSNYGFTMPEDKKAFLEEVYSIRSMGANLDTEMKERVMEDDSRILILSTCNQVAPDQRFLVMAILD